MTAKLFWLCLGSILYTYAGFPILLTLLARTRPKPPAYKAASPTVTLIITAYNEETAIAEKLENSLSLDYPADRLQVLVAADGSNDRTADIVRAFAQRGVELSYNPPRRGKMAAINRAVPLARGEILVFSDANNMYEPNALRELVAPFADPSVGGVTGAKSILGGDGALGESEGMYWKYESFIKQQETRLGCTTGAVGEIMAIRRNLFAASSDSVILDDFYMAMNLMKRGYRFVYTPKARSLERVSASAQDEVVRRAKIIAGRYQAITLAPQLLPLQNPLVVWQVVSHKFLRPLVPLAMIGALFANLIAVIHPVRSTKSPMLHLAPPFNWLFWGLQLLFYGLAWIGGRTKRHGKLWTILYLPTFLVNSNLAAVIGLWHFLTRRQNTLWQRVQRRDSPVAAITAEA